MTDSSFNPNCLLSSVISPLVILSVLLTIISYNLPSNTKYSVILALFSLTSLSSLLISVNCVIALPPLFTLVFFCFKNICNLSLFRFIVINFFLNKVLYIFFICNTLCFIFNNILLVYKIIVYILLIFTQKIFHF